MAINISKLLSAISAKAANADSSQSLVELIRIAQATTLANDVKQARIYSSFASLPTADSSNVGDIVRVGSVFDSDITKYYVSHGDKWKLITLQDSASIDQGPVPYSFQGSNFGYVSGGLNPPVGIVNTISKFSFSVDENASEVGNLSIAARYTVAGQSSSTHGYTSGGNPIPAAGNIIDKFPFASDGTALDVGDLTVARYDTAGQSSSSHGYNSGGTFPTVNIIDKFPFSSDVNAIDVGDLTQTRYGSAGQSSSISGYTSGGYSGPYRNTIDKFPFASDASASDVGDLTQARMQIAGQSSTENGYSSGGIGTNPFPSKGLVIDKFPFSSDASATDVGVLTVARYYAAGQSSTISGYTSSGDPGLINTIDKFPFASDAGASDVGDLVNYQSQSAGQQY